MPSQTGKVRGAVVGLQLSGYGGLPGSGEGVIVIQPEDASSGLRGLRLGGPGTNPAGTVTSLQFEDRARLLIRLYCRKELAEFDFAEIGASLPDIVAIDGI